MKDCLEAMTAVTDCLRRLHLRPPSQIRFKTIASTPRTAGFSRSELLAALHMLDYEGAIALHPDNSFSVLKPADAL